MIKLLYSSINLRILGSLLLLSYHFILLCIQHPTLRRGQAMQGKDVLNTVFMHNIVSYFMTECMKPEIQGIASVYAVVKLHPVLQVEE